LVSGGILIINPLGKKSNSRSGFIVPYLNSRYFVIPFWILLYIVLKQTNLTGQIHQFIDLPTIHSIPYLFLVITAVAITVMSLVKAWSFIPVLGLLTNLYLMSELGITNWFRFGIWLVAGLVIYFGYSIFHSKLSGEVSTQIVKNTTIDSDKNR
jgi:hypothetical protein